MSSRPLSFRAIKTLVACLMGVSGGGILSCLWDKDSPKDKLADVEVISPLFGRELGAFFFGDPIAE